MMKRSMMNVFLAVGLAMGATTAAAAGFPETPVRRCGPDAVLAGTVFLDR